MLNLFDKISGVKVLLSEKKDGNMKLFSPDFENTRKKYLEKNDLDYEKLVSAKLEHGNNVEIIKNRNKEFINYCDGLISQNPEIILSVTSADCLPVFLFDFQKKIIAILHCSWRSVARELIENCLEKMEKEFSVKPKDVLVGIGPGIQKCHFEVKDDLRLEFPNHQEFFSGEEKLFFDLTGVVKKKLIDLNIGEQNIGIDSRCTFCDESLWSYRRDGESRDGIQAMMGAIKLF